jgi:hypothetical protein
MHEEKFKSLTEQVASIRYEYFLKRVADTTIVWGLYNEGWGLVEDEDHNQAVAVWPDIEFALACASDLWSDYNPKEIEVHEFVDDFLPGLASDGLKTAVFMTLSDRGIIAEPLQLKQEIQDQLLLIE